MKKLFTLIAFIGLAFGANAQRHCDIQVTVTSNAPTVTSGQKYPFVFVIKNLGPDALKSSDTCQFQTIIDAGATGVSRVFGVSLAANDSLVVPDTVGMYLYSAPADSANKPICVLFVPERNNGTDSVMDPDLTNNIGCGSVTVLDVNDVVFGANSLNVYPNPAQGQANFAINLNKTANVSIRIFDMIGRQVYSNNAGNVNAGKHVYSANTSGFADGIYLYQVTVGDETKTGKFNVAK